MNYFIIIFVHIRNFFSQFDKNLTPWGLNIYTSNAIIGLTIMIFASINNIYQLFTKEDIIDFGKLNIPTFILLVIIGNVLISLLIKSNKHFIISLSQKYDDEISFQKSKNIGSYIFVGVFVLFIFTFLFRIWFIN